MERFTYDPRNLFVGLFPILAQPNFGVAVAVNALGHLVPVRIENSAIAIDLVFFKAWHLP